MKKTHLLNTVLIALGAWLAATASGYCYCWPSSHAGRSAAASAFTAEEILRATKVLAKPNPPRFFCKYQGGETDLLYYGYRYYNPSTGRWLSRDPKGENGGKNLLSFASNKPTITVDPKGLCECGEDVTARVSKVLSDISYYYHNWTSDRQVNACKWIIGRGPLGIEGAKHGWGIKQLAWAGARVPSGLEVGECRGQPTVTFSRNCHFAGAVNYSMFGVIMRLCRDSAQADPESFENLPYDYWSLMNANVLVMGWLALNDGFPPGHEVTRSKMGFTSYGYNWHLSSAAVPQGCGQPSTRFSSGDFDWIWYPNTRPWPERW